MCRKHEEGDVSFYGCDALRRRQSDGGPSMQRLPCRLMDTGGHSPLHDSSFSCDAASLHKISPAEHPGFLYAGSLGILLHGDNAPRRAEGNENTIIYNIPDTTVWMPGDTVNATVRCSRVENFTGDFDYRRYMEERGVFYTCFFGKNSTLEILKNGTPPLRMLPARLRWKFSAAVDSAMPSEEMARIRAVVKALAYGYQDEIPAGIEESFRQSGAIHLLALSGMHLGLLYGLLLKLLALIGNSPTAKRIRSTVIIAALWAFTIFTGCGVSILRAAVMFKLSYAAMTAIFLIFPHLRAIVKTRNRISGRMPGDHRSHNPAALRDIRVLLPAGQPALFPDSEHRDAAHTRSPDYSGYRQRHTRTSRPSPGAGHRAFHTHKRHYQQLIIRLTKNINFYCAKSRKRGIFADTI